MKKVAIFVSVAGIVVGLATVATSAYGYFAVMSNIAQWLGRYHHGYGSYSRDGVTPADFADEELTRPE